MKTYNIFCLILSTIIGFSYALKLRGVTMITEPFVRVESIDGKPKFSGFLVDLIDEISKKSNFEYELYVNPDNRYGITRNGTFDGMLGQVQSNKADFTLADLTITPFREKYFDFTEPYIELELGAILRKSNLGEMKSLGDLSEQTAVKYGFIHSGSTNQYFRYTKNDKVNKMFNTVLQTPGSYVEHSLSGTYKVKKSNYAFISESLNLEYIAGLDCELTVLKDVKKEFPDSQRKYGIAVQQNSTIINLFNTAINELKSSGKIDELKKKYWSGNCSK